MSSIYNIKSFVSEGIVYEFTNDKKLLRQYAQLVDLYYKKDLDLDLAENNMQGGLVDLMQDEHVYIVRENDRVIAGARVNFASVFRSNGVSGSNGLPMEEDSFTVDGYLPDEYNHQTYGEIGRLVVDPTYRGKDVLKKMISELIEFSVRQQCGYLFVLAPVLNSVLYRRICRSLNIPITVHKDAAIPDKPLYRRLDIKLLSCDLRNITPAYMPVSEAI